MTEGPSERTEAERGREPALPGQEATRVVGRYELIEPIGKGGLATVHRARDTLLDREVAVKIFDATATSRRAIRLQEDEARRAAALEHPSLARLYDVGSRTGPNGDPQTFLVMEYLRGGDLGRMIKTRALTPREVAAIGHDAATALRFLHRHGLLHRDLKPQNILLTGNPRVGRLQAKITDLGISSVIGANPGQGTMDGTAAYIAPEQVEGADPTEAGDVYALGLVLLEALSGRIEFPGSYTTTVLARLDRDPVVPEGLPRPLDEALRGMTIRDPRRRMALPVVIDLLKRGIAAFADEDRAATTDSAEALRVAAVRRYGVSNAEPDEALTRVTSLAQVRYRTRIALLSIVEEDRVWVKAGAAAGHERIDRDLSGCAVAVATGRTLVVTDTEDHEWARSNDLLAQLGLRSLLAAPLISTDGYAVGAMCVGDIVPREWTAREISDLEDLAAIAMRELEMRSAARGAVFDI